VQCPTYLTIHKLWQHRVWVRPSARR